MRQALRVVLRLVAVAVAAALAALLAGGAVQRAGASPGGLVAAYSFDDGAGTAASDSSGNGRTGTIAGAAWAPAGKFGSALSFDGSSARVDPPALGTFYKTGFTYEAW